MRALLSSFLLLLPMAGCLQAAPPFQDPWHESFANLDATGPHVLGFWKFDELPLADASGHGASLVLKGAALSPEGRFGGALNCSGSAGASGGAVTLEISPRHSPAGAFSMEMWVRPNSEAHAEVPACLLDKQGTGQGDYRWSLLPADARGRRQMSVRLGFGSYTKEFLSEPVTLAADAWRHLAFTYDGAGKGAFYLDSYQVGGGQHECAAIQPGAQPLSLGNDLSLTQPFQGVVDEVRLCAGVRGFAAWELSISAARKVFQRMEKPLPMKVRLVNLRPQALMGADMSFVVSGVEQSFILPDLSPGQVHETEFSPDTAMKPGSHTLEVRTGQGALQVRKWQDFLIVPRTAEVFPVIVDGASESDLPKLQGLACTHWTALGNVDAPYLGPHDRHHHLQVQPRMDLGLVSGIRTVAALAPWQVLMQDARMHRLRRDGQAWSPVDLDAANGGLSSLTGNVGQRLMVAFREYASWAGVWLNAEPRSRAQPGFSVSEMEAWRKVSGTEIPAEILSGSGVDWQTLPGFPADRVVPDDHPVLRYYQWFWSGGHGWKSVQEAWHLGMDRRRQERTDVWTLHEPAVRQPSIAGTDMVADFIGDGPVDARDPMFSGLCADQLQAMNAAHGRKKPFWGLLPLHWEREMVSPHGAANTAESILIEDLEAPARHITIAPALLQLNAWMMLSRPVKGLVWKGWPALSGRRGSSEPLRATHDQAYAALCRWTDRLLRPLGPMLLRRDALRSPVAMLESFTSQMFSGRGFYRGASAQSLEVLRALQQAHVQTDLVYEESLMADGLEGRKILILTDCEVLPAGLVKRLGEWQRAGGRIIADASLCPALKPDALISDPVGATEAAPKTQAQELEEQCRTFGWVPEVTCDQPDVVLHATRNGDATCLFVINNRREAGAYVGQHGLVKENGLAVSTSLNLGQESVNVYDLTRSSFVLPKREDQGLTLPLQLGPAEGRVLLLSPAPLLEMKLDLPETATCGNVAEARITLTSSGGRPMPAAIPVAVRIRDAEGTPAEWDGYHVVDNGELVLRLQLARDEAPGDWEVHVRELASGMEAVKWMKVRQ